VFHLEVIEEDLSQRVGVDPRTPLKVGDGIDLLERPFRRF
jgi:hypothetical protein